MPDRPATPQHSPLTADRKGVLRRPLAAVIAISASLLAGHGRAAQADVRRPVPPRAEIDGGTGAERAAAPRPAIAVAVRTDRRVVALSFDDGPDPRWTPAILEALDAAGAHATFFVTGEHVQDHPALARALVAGGHEVANHTDTHPLLDTLAPADVDREVRRTDAALVAAGVPRTGFFRPPKGRYDAAVLSVVEAAGLRTVGWTVCVERWLRTAGPLLGVEAVAERVHPGAILLAHDGGIPDRSATVAALPALLARLQTAGYELVTVGELLHRDPAVLGLPGDIPPLAILSGAL